MKPGMWQYVDSARIFFSSPEQMAHGDLLWWVAVLRPSLCVVRRQCLECEHSREPDCDKTLSRCLFRQNLGKNQIWLLTGLNLGHPGVM